MIYKHREPELQGLETPAYKLSAVVGADSFFYAIESGPDRLVHLETYFQDKPLALFEDPFDFLADLMAENPLLFESFDRKCFGIVGVPYLVVAAEELRQSSPVKLLGRMTHLAAKDAVQLQLIPGLDAACIFAVPQALRHEVEMYFDGPVYNHLMGSMLEWMANHSPANLKEGKWLHLHNIGPYAFLIGVDQGNMVFHNQFRCVEVFDLIYFTSAIMENLGWKTGDIKLSLSGHRRSEVLSDAVFDRLFSPCLVDLPIKTEWPEEAHDYLDLLALSRCAS